MVGGESFSDHQKLLYRGVVAFGEGNGEFQSEGEKYYNVLGGAQDSSSVIVGERRPTLLPGTS